MRAQSYRVPIKYLSCVTLKESSTIRAAHRTCHLEHVPSDNSRRIACLFIHSTTSAISANSKIFAVLAFLQHCRPAYLEIRSLILDPYFKLGISGRGYSFGICVILNTLWYFMPLFYIFRLSSFRPFNSIPQISEKPKKAGPKHGLPVEKK